VTLATHLSTGETTLAYCWVVNRTDGVIIGVTDHDQDITTFEQSLGLNPDDLEIRGAFDSDLFREDEMRSGLFDNAVVKLYVANWQNPSEFKKLAEGRFGELQESEGGGFRAAFLSRASDLSQPSGRMYQRSCDTKLGSARCGIDLSDPAYSTTTTVLGVDGATVTLANLSGYEKDWFTLGRAVFSAESVPVRLHAGNVLELWRVPERPVTIGDTVTVEAGCKRDSETCRVKFSNIANFQGFPYMPGQDALTSYPVRGQGDYSGGSLFK